jgi:phosphohistidine phosphatase SixA
MALLVLLHRVKDYAAWRKVYDEVAPMQKAGGVTAESVFRAKDDPNNVLVLHHFASMPEAVAFMNGSDLREAMERAGVEGEPRLEFYDEA